jgi:hypothetical protein
MLALQRAVGNRGVGRLVGACARRRVDRAVQLGGRIVTDANELDALLRKYFSDQEWLEAARADGSLPRVLQAMTTSTTIFYSGSEQEKARAEFIYKKVNENIDDAGALPQDARMVALLGKAAGIYPPPPGVPETLRNPTALLERFFSERDRGTLLIKDVPGSSDLRYDIAVGRASGPMSSKQTQLMHSVSLVVKGAGMKTYFSPSIGLLYAGSTSRIHATDPKDTGSSDWSIGDWYERSGADLGPAGLTDLATRFAEQPTSESAPGTGTAVRGHNEVLTTLEASNLLGFYYQCHAQTSAEAHRSSLRDLAGLRQRLDLPRVPLYRFDPERSMIEPVPEAEVNAAREG